MNLKAALATLPQYILPQHGLSKLMSLFTHSTNKPLKNMLIRQISSLYQVDMQEALHSDVEAYPSFNHFFTRELKPGSRPIAAGEQTIVSPADGVISQVGKISGEDIFQAKGKSFDSTTLLGGDAQQAALFQDGLFATIYLSPRDYHRLHMPLAGRLTHMHHVPGRLFSVNNVTTENVPGLFARNERVVCLFDTAAGPMALILVGAIFVSSIETVWHGVVTPPSCPSVRTWDYAGVNPPSLVKGAEMGRFNMGSTIIVLFPQQRARWHDLYPGKPIKMGEALGQYLAS